MLKVYAKTEIDSLLIDEIEEAAIKRYIHRKIAAGLGERMIKDDLVTFERTEEPTQHTLLASYTGSVITATAEEKREYEMMRAFIKVSGNQEAFEDYKRRKEAQQIHA